MGGFFLLTGVTQRGIVRVMAIRVWKDIPLVRRAGGHFPLGRGNPMDNATTKYSEDVATESNRERYQRGFPLPRGKCCQEMRSLS